MTTSYNNVSVAPKPAFRDRSYGQTFALAISPSYLVKSWCDAGRPTVRVEKGYGSGVYQDLYPHIDGKLYTGPWGTGTEASSWAGGSKLLVETPYNQCAADLVTGHPVKLSNDKRVLLNVSTANAPFFAGYSTGTQDASQHATQRGYSISQTLKTNAGPLTLIAVHQHNSTENCDMVQDTAGTPTQYWRLDGTLKRHYDTWATAVANFAKATVPNVNVLWGVNNGRGIATEASERSGVGGVYRGDTFLYNTSGTTYNLNVMGPTNSLQGKLFALMIATAALSDASMRYDGIPARLAALATNAVATDNPSVVFPFDNAVVPMNLATETADIPVILYGKPSTAYEANWQGGSYTTIGTTDVNGYVKGAMTSQAKGNGTFNVREVGGSTPIAITNVAVGIKIVVSGESDPDGRNDNVTHTIPTGSLRLNHSNWTANSNEWWKLVCQGLYDQFGAVISVVKATAGGTLFMNGVGQEGHWSLSNTSYSPHMAATVANRAFQQQVDITTPNFWIMEIGKNDAASVTSSANFLSRYRALMDSLKTQLNNTSIAWDVVAIGNNTGTSAANTDTIRLALLSNIDGTTYRMAGSMAHLPTTEVSGVHLKTQSEKQAAADVVIRHWRHHWLGGAQARAPRYLSASKSTNTITVTLTGGTSPMTISSSSDTTGWDVTDGSGANAVTAVNVSGLVVTLTLTRTINGTATVKWGSAATSIGTTLLDSDGTTPLPPEPFEITV